MDVTELYGLKDVFNFRFYSTGINNALLFKIETVKENTFKMFDDGYSKLIITDALVDIKLLNEILEGRYDLNELKIVGETPVRDLEHLDHELSLNVNYAKIDALEIAGTCDGCAVVKITFKFRTRLFGKSNVYFTVDK
jgi:hypothetical protein